MGNAEFPLIDLYSFSNELISQHNVIGFRGPLHIYDGKLLNIYNPNEISWGGDIEKMEGERRFAFIPVALPHCISLPLPPSLCLSLSLSCPVSRTLPSLSSVSLSHITSVPPVVQPGITSGSVNWVHSPAQSRTFNPCVAFGSIWPDSMFNVSVLSGVNKQT